MYRCIYGRYMNVLLFYFCWVFSRFEIIKIIFY
jgi:hypothetical protein